MKPGLENAKERFTHQLEKDLVYFANRQNKSLSYSAANTIAQRVLENADLENPAFQHKGTSWLARIIVDNFPAPKIDPTNEN
ncbi:hypothetical protein [Planomicrobium sp. MB-3u-38]|uniref:hypothetical protein n=1 Tax=Planomicrobium sp. MB-3u-38 TaxID=2058318 RepID=UPI000C7E4F25|nr:hypothetical protein [Planomicrobium sp. MB-3u-38]PKH11710.1 hypothetical protein CXF70_03180 [Planomicrobium sp. MB-3u-38]